LIAGTVLENGVPGIFVEVAGQSWRAIIDTGFNGDLELPSLLRGELNAQFVGRLSSLLAANMRVEEDVYLVDFLFDGNVVRAEATFVDSDEILIGTGMLQEYRLLIDFPAQTVSLETA
jgi:predicted aspartyl protease